MSWEDDLNHILTNLNVQQEEAHIEQNNSAEVEKTKPEQTDSPQEASFFYTQVSHDRPGVAYRMDLVECVAELRVFVPTNGNPTKMQCYLVRLSKGCFLGHLFALYMASGGGSPAFQEIEGVATFHLFQTMTETMKALFWQGDLLTLQFPPEIEVQRLIS